MVHSFHVVSKVIARPRSPRFCLCFLLEILWFSILFLWLILSHFFVKNVKSMSNFFFFFCKWMSDYSSTSFWKNLFFYIDFPLLPCPRLVDCICIGLFLHFLFYSINVCISPFTKILSYLLWVNGKSCSLVVSVLQLCESSLLCWLFGPLIFPYKL